MIENAANAHQGVKKKPKDGHPHNDPKHEARHDIRGDLDNLERELADLKMRFEQYFTGLQPFAPEKQHAAFKHAIRVLRKTPFKSSALNYRLKAIESRYNTFNTYWQRVLRAKEEGTYSKDVFKAEIRDRSIQEEKRALTPQGISERNMKNLFNTYRDALEKQTGKKQPINFEAFQSSLVQRVKQLKESSGGKKFSFKVALKDGKVTLKAKVKE